MAQTMLGRPLDRSRRMILSIDWRPVLDDFHGAGRDAPALKHRQEVPRNRHDGVRMAQQPLLDALEPPADQPAECPAPPAQYPCDRDGVQILEPEHERRAGVLRCIGGGRLDFQGEFAEMTTSG